MSPENREAARAGIRAGVLCPLAGIPDARVSVLDPDPSQFSEGGELAFVLVIKAGDLTTRAEITEAMLNLGTLGPNELGRFIGRQAVAVLRRAMQSAAEKKTSQP